jgi:hypothetical protein
MTLDLTVSPADVSGTLRRQVAQYTGPVSYVTGGDPISATAPDFRMGNIRAILGNSGATNGVKILMLWFDPVAYAIVWYDPLTGAQVAPGTNLSAFTTRLEAIGT